jgi:hypothetical protein
MKEASHIWQEIDRESFTDCREFVCLTCGKRAKMSFSQKRTAWIRDRSYWSQCRPVLQMSIALILAVSCLVGCRTAQVDVSHQPTGIHVTMRVEK